MGRRDSRERLRSSDSRLRNLVRLPHLLIRKETTSGPILLPFSTQTQPHPQIHLPDPPQPDTHSAINSSTPPPHQILTPSTTQIQHSLIVFLTARRRPRLQDWRRLLQSNNMQGATHSTGTNRLTTTRPRQVPRKFRVPATGEAWSRILARRMLALVRAKRRRVVR